MDLQILKPNDERGGDSLSKQETFSCNQAPAVICRKSELMRLFDVDFTIPRPWRKFQQR